MIDISSVVLVEDHDLSRIGLKTALEQVEGIQVLGEAKNGLKGLTVIEQTQPDVAIIDIGLPDIDGIRLTQLLKKSPLINKTKILILTMHRDEKAILAAFAAGADSYSLKDVSISHLVQVIKATHEGNSWIDPNVAKVILKQVNSPIFSGSKEKSPDYNPTLTERELEVLKLIVDGCNNALISEKLFITVGTVKTHVSSILSKLSVNDRTQAAVTAIRKGLVK
jgi:DNA-binding NarL/FixJ family response regulator